ncbi:TIGR01440 family protein [Rossellomorea sp. AcN35-11]|nr:TIGR01440 family protein [Rossellomorea aquimaris]NMH70597.1 TIGR01440 family protein [Bacillus sp. RO3]WJV30692.1 TIGR01440 family protein [Rossellomorea sp. AcN35-11]
MEIAQLKKDLQTILHDFAEQVPMKAGQVFVVGCSTSEVMGERIGTSGTIEVAEMIFDELKGWADSMGVSLAFQCCEHLNRALVLEREAAERKGLDEVTVIPVRKAGGAMATQAYHSFDDPVMVEHIKADAGIDIGDTFIGMHLKHVAVPVRTPQKSLGEAHVTLAKTRPKLIGGIRAVYE